MQTPFELNYEDQKTPTSQRLIILDDINPTLLENYDLSEQPTPTEEIVSTTPKNIINNQPITQVTSQETPQETPQLPLTSLQNLDISFDFGPLLQKYQNYVANCQQTISNINNAIASINEMINFNVVRDAKLDNYNSSKLKIEGSMTEYNIRIQNIVDIQNLNQTDLDNLYILYTYLGNVNDFLTMLTMKYTNILADTNFIDLMSDKLNSTNNKTIIAQHIYQTYSQ